MSELNITTRNYLRLLRAGAFQEQEGIEPMSAWKWGQVYDMSLLHHTTALAYDGIQHCDDQFFMHIPDKLRAQWLQQTKTTEEEHRQTREQAMQLLRQLHQSQSRPILTGSLVYSSYYARPNHRPVDNISIFFPYPTQAQKADTWAESAATDVNYTDRHTMKYRWQGLHVTHHHRFMRLSNKLLSHSLQNLVEQELRESRTAYYDDDPDIETLNPTLTLFQILLRLSCDLIAGTIQLIDLVDTGSFLRSIGDRVDYIKLQAWIEKLKMQRMVPIIAQLLVELLAFAEDELPFTTIQKRADLSDIVSEILVPSTNRSKRMMVTQSGHGIFLHTSNTSAFVWHARRSAKFMRYYPSESITSLFSSFARSLTNIEE